jgi:hypothetical protein
MISDALSAAGYNCGYVGKWHMGEDATPGHGYKFTYTMGTGRYQDPVMYRNGQKVEEKGYLTELMTSQACRFIDEQKAGAPFFLAASYFNPHVPYDGHPQKYYDMYAGTKFDSVDYAPAAPNALREKDLLQDTLGARIRTSRAELDNPKKPIGVFLLDGIVVGRMACGWVCPFGALHQLIGWLGRRGRKHSERVAVNQYQPARVSGEVGVSTQRL